MAKPIKVVFKKSDKPEKKMLAVFTLDNGRTKKTYFGQSGAPDYTKTKDKEQKKRYITRHRKNENWSAPMTAGALSRWVLWHLTSRSEAKAAFKKRFNLS
tara:strand:+ start:2609 stop:2908 length:300 start_codon:yes stop_codon:yes gene_type:complete